MDSNITNVVDGILTAILQWRVSWLDEQKIFSRPPPICRSEAKKLKITYTSYKDYETTFVPLIMYEIWAQIFGEWLRVDSELRGPTAMDIDEEPLAITICNNNQPFRRVAIRQFDVGVSGYGIERQHQLFLKCQTLVGANKVSSHMKIIGEGDLVLLELIVQPQNIIKVFGYVKDVSSEKINNYTDLSEAFYSGSKNGCTHVINHHIIIAKRQLTLDTSSFMKITNIYYLKPMIRQIESVIMLQNSSLARDILNPNLSTCQISIPTISKKSTHYNDSQYEAIIGANQAMISNTPKIQLIQGPPGTGKTHTLIGIIKYFYTHWQDASSLPKILICTPSNGAIDEVARRLYSEREFMKRSVAKRSLRIVRVGHTEQISENIKHISLENLVETNCNKGDDKIPVSEAQKRTLRHDLVKNADVILTTLNSCQRHPLDSMFRGDNTELKFRCLIVDEASQCCEPELLMPLCYKISKIILIGDPMQLPATVISKHAQDFDYGRSLFERFFVHFGEYAPGSPVAMLREQYRMHPDICNFPSKQFYNGRLVTSEKAYDDYPIRPYLICDLRNSVESKSDKNSIENEIEASFVRNALVSVLSLAPPNSKIGVITPYKGQKRLITNKINSLQLERKVTVEVNTCDGFQGQEKDIIILSCVRAFDSKSWSSVGFLKSFQRINVALTRAKHSLIVGISARSLSTDKIWQKLINDALDRKCLLSFTQTPSIKTLTSLFSKTNSPHNNCNNRLATNNNIGEPTSYNYSGLVRTRDLPSQGIGYEPEFIIPMDID